MVDYLGTYLRKQWFRGGGSLIGIDPLPIKLFPLCGMPQQDRGTYSNHILNIK